MTTIAGYEVHPAAELYPMLSSVELAKLSRDIAENGQIQPIMVKGKVLLDGRNRLLACKMACVEPWIVEWAGDSAVAYIASTNLRRNLDESQRAMLAVQLLPMLEQEASERRKAGLRRGSEQGSPSAPTGANGKAAKVAAEAVGVGERTVERAKAVATKAPELVEQVRAGEVSLREAERQVAHKLLGGSAKGRGAEADEANTPEGILELVRQVAPIGLDPCWNEAALTKPRIGFTIEQDGLKQQWRVRDGELVFANYPFTESEAWTGKVAMESDYAPIVLLTKIDTRVSWWMKLRTHPNYLSRVQLDGYWKFGGSPNPAPFSVALWLFAPDDALASRFVEVMREHGEMVYPSVTKEMASKAREP